MHVRVRVHNLRVQLISSSLIVRLQHLVQYSLLCCLRLCSMGKVRECLRVAAYDTVQKRGRRLVNSVARALLVIGCHAVAALGRCVCPTSPSVCIYCSPCRRPHALARKALLFRNPYATHSHSHCALIARHVHVSSGHIPLH